MDEDVESLAQEGDSMFVRNVGHASSRGREVIIHLDGMPPVVGFFAGLDDEFVQVCLSSNQALVEIKRVYIIMVEETGKTLNNHAKLTSGPESILTEDEVRRIREKTDHFRRKSAYLFRRK